MIDVDKALAQTQPPTASQGITKVYVGDIPVALTENDVRELFEAVGVVENVEIKKDHESNYGFVKYVYINNAYTRFKRPEEARKALLIMNGLRLYNDYRIKVGLWNEARSMDPIEPTNDENDNGNLIDYSLILVEVITAQKRQQLYSNYSHQSAPVNSGEQFATKNIRLTNMFDPTT
jgi:RNA recognition motif-containing protein